MAFLDAPVVSVAFPALHASFPSTSPTSLAWVLDAYFVGFAAFLVVAGKLSDRFGRRPMFLTGMSLFSLASLGCAVAPSAGLLIAARAAQAIAAAMVVPSGQALMLSEFPAEERQKALGVLAALIGLATGFAPTIGGVVVDTVGWRWVFYGNVFVGAAATLYGIRLLRGSEQPERAQRLPDLLGGALVAAGLSFLVLGILKTQGWGAGDPRTLGSFAVAVACLAMFIVRCRRHPVPVLDLTLFADRTFAVANLSSLVFALGLYGAMITQVLYFTSVWGLSVLSIGLAFAPASILGAVVGVPAGRIAARNGPRGVAVAGSLAAAVGVAYIALRSGATEHYVLDWLPGQLINGVGVVAALTGLVGAALISAPPEQFALASGVNSAVRQVGGAVGVAIAVAIAGSVTGSDALTRGHEAFWVSTGGLLLAGVAAAFMRAPGAQPARRGRPSFLWPTRGRPTES